MDNPLGWISPSQRTRDMELADEFALSQMPARFRLTETPRTYQAGEMVNLMELWTRPEVASAIGYAFTGTHQLSGSCVGAGGGNVLFSLTCVEVLRAGEREKLYMPFWLYSYGISRELLGETSEGEGSLGSTFAEAVRQYGVLDNANAELPKPTNGDGLTWGQQIEMKWSNGRAIAPKWKELGKKHLVRTTAPIRSGQEAFDAIMNGYPVTFACNWFVGPEGARVQGTGADQCVIATLDQRGGHQTSLQAAWMHPTLGPLVWNLNQWGLKCYKADPKLGSGAGTWMKISEVDRALRSGDAEVFTFSQFDGFPAQTLSWADLLP